MIGDISRKLFDTSVSGHDVSEDKALVLDYLTTVIETSNGVYLRSSPQGEFTIKPYTQEFQVHFSNEI